MEVYGTSVADKLDRGRGLLKRRYFRQHCTVDYSGYTKDLSAIHSDLTSIFILDNSPAAYRQFPRKFNLDEKNNSTFQIMRFRSSRGFVIHVIRAC
jgi:TFIIF-interacting CTD phosphatase-like protein